MIRNRLLVVAVWVFLALFGFHANANLNSLLTTSISVPGSESDKADKLIESAFGETTEGAFSIFYTYDKNLPKSEVVVSVNLEYCPSQTATILPPLMLEPLLIT